MLLNAQYHLGNPKYSYRPGILFLYDVESRRYIQWDTQDGDTEVILVDSDQVYYRVDQSISRAKIEERQLVRQAGIAG